MVSKEYTDYLVHRDHKYIDKHKSKSGKWVYVYNKIKDGLETNKKVEAEEDAWEGEYDVSPATLYNKTGKSGGSYSFNKTNNSALKRTNKNEQGVVTYNVKNGKQLFDSYSESTRIQNHAPNEFGNTATVNRTSNITYGYLHRATNQIEKGKKAVEKFLKKTL